jgi:hypothetical protein
MLDKELILAALAEKESSGGRNNCPRFEPAYIPVGERFTIQGRVIVGTGRGMSPVARQRWSMWGLASAASYSPWQILYHTAADLGYTGPPWDLWDPKVSRPWATLLLEKILSKGATTIEQVADAWNSGNFHDAVYPEGYIKSVAAIYNSYFPSPSEVKSV